MKPAARKASINGMAVEVPFGSSILDAARAVQVDIPTLCKHKDLLPTAACGLCIVKVGGSRKMPRACATEIEDGMEIVTHDAELTEIRKATIELILSNHPNACLTCGRNGDCELQTIAGNFGIRQDVIPRYVRDLEPDCSTGSIIMDFTKCIKCGRCVQVCQEMQNVWALSFLERGINNRMAPAGDISLSESPCVRCGQCSAHCPTGAIVENDETTTVWEALRDSSKYCVVQVAPSVRVALGEAFGYPPGTDLTGKIYSVLRRLGFKAVFDTTFAADLTILEEAAEFVDRFASGKGELPLITSCCPAWVDYMEKRFADFIPNFSTAKSPQQMLGVMAKTYFASESGIDPATIYQVSIMPCTAKKYELERSEEMYASGHKDVDVALTTREFARMIKQSGIAFRDLPEGKSDSILGTYSGAGVLFGNTGGVMEAALRTAYFMVSGKNLEKEAINIMPVRGLDGIKSAALDVQGTEVRVAVAHGLGNVERLLLTVRQARRNGEPPPYHFIEVMACPGGCIGGGGQPYGVCDELRRQRMKGIVDSDLGMALRFSHENPEIKKIYSDFLGEPLGEKAHQLLHTRYKDRPAYQR
ncbi:MAG: 4Fe-4S dicluster domain-containing protein [Puniceicoccaceae bacterium]|nr:MAG: 4Fe-4S dicluster domain-containing protein [Puniceicoccaceae bacterium]